MFQYDKNTLTFVEKQLNVNCPPPESLLIKLSHIVAYLPKDEQSTRIRRFALDTDELISEVRWHLGQALLLMKTHPHILKAEEDENEFAIKEIPTDVQHLLRGFMRQPEKVLYNDLSESRRGGTVAGWIFHMMIDSSVYRAIAALDRIAHILWSAAELSEDRIYFRSKKVKKLDEIFDCPESHELLKIAESPLFELIINYRDGLAHYAKLYAHFSSTPPVDMWTTPNGKEVISKPGKWDADLFFALGNAAFHQVIEALTFAVSICEKKWPIQQKE